MKLAVITPVGPGHEKAAEAAIASVTMATYGDHPFRSVRHVVIEDKKGFSGRSASRNRGMKADADWYFFLDADDTMRPDALGRNIFTSPATFGSVSLNGTVIQENVYPCSWRRLALYGAHGTLSMGFFCRADIARSLRFNEDMDAGEDFDFYMRLPGFTKLAVPLVDIGYDLPSAGGPRGYDKIDWVGICNRVIAAAVKREPEKYDLRGDALLAKAGGIAPEPREIPGAVPEPTA